MSQLWDCLLGGLGGLVSQVSSTLITTLVAKSHHTLSKLSMGLGFITWGCAGVAIKNMRFNSALQRFNSCFSSRRSVLFFRV